MCQSRYVLKCTNDKKKQYVYILKSKQCGKIGFVKHILPYHILTITIPYSTP